MHGHACIVRMTAQGSSRAVKTTERVGFSSLPDQLVNHELDRGFTLNILCIGTAIMAIDAVLTVAGETGIGKSTLVDSLFKTSLPDHPQTHANEQVDLRVSTFELVESGVRLQLTVAETIGFGDQLNKVCKCHVCVVVVIPGTPSRTHN